MATQDEIDAVMALITAAYPMLSIPRATMDIYAEELSDVPAEFILDAARKHVRRCRFFPTIAELRESYDVHSQKLAMNAKDRQWKSNLEEWRREALSAGEAQKMLAEVVDAASKQKGTEIVPFRGRGLKRMLAEKAK